jgi:hypothetical protein
MVAESKLRTRAKRHYCGMDDRVVLPVPFGEDRGLRTSLEA